MRFNIDNDLTCVFDLCIHQLTDITDICGWRHTSEPGVDLKIYTAPENVLRGKASLQNWF